MVASSSSPHPPPPDTSAPALPAAGVRHGWLLRHGWIVPVYLLLALWQTAPLLWQMGTALGGISEDALQSYWDAWWLRYALFEVGQNPFAGRWMHHPFGLPLYFHTFNPLGNALLLPVQWCCGTVVAYNTQIILLLLLAGVAMYALVWHLTQMRAAALLAGIVYACNPFMQQHLRLGQVQLLAVYLLPLYLLALLHGIAGRRAGWWAAGGVLVLLAYTELHYTVYALLLTPLVWLDAVLGERRRALPMLRQFALVGLIFVVGFLPLLLPMLWELAHTPSVARGITDTVRRSADLTAFIIPNNYHPLWGVWADGLFRAVQSPGIATGWANPGYVALLLAVAAVLWQRQATRLWLMIGGLFGVLALGPFLQVGGVNSYDTALPIPLPYLLLRELPLMNIQRVPSRFIIGVLLAVAVLAGIGVQALWQQFQRRGWRIAHGRLALVGVGCLLLFESWTVPLPLTPMQPAQISPFYHQLGTIAPPRPDDAAILEVPYLENVSSLYQTYHRHPTIGGVIARKQPHPWQSGRFFRPLLQLDPDWTDVGMGDTPAAARQALRCQGVRHVVFYQQHGRTLEDPQAPARLEADLFGGIAPTYADAMLRAYTLPLSETTQPYWTLASGEWYNPQQNEQGTPYRWARGDQGRLHIYPCVQAASSTAHGMLVAAQFDLYGVAGERQVALSWNGAPLGVVPVAERELRRVHLLLPVQAGENTLLLADQVAPVVPVTLGFTDDERLLSFNISQVLITPVSNDQ